MKYEIDFNDNCADLFFREIYFAFERCEKSFRDRDLERNISNAVAFQTALRVLQIFGIETECGTWHDNGFVHICYAAINGHTIVRKTVFNHAAMVRALKELEKPEDDCSRSAENSGMYEQKTITGNGEVRSRTISKHQLTDLLLQMHPLKQGNSGLIVESNASEVNGWHWNAIKVTRGSIVTQFSRANPTA